MLKWAALVVFAVATLAMLYVVTHLANLLDAKHRQRSVTYVRLLQVMGAWEISVGLVVVAAGGPLPSALGPLLVGLAMLFGGPAWARLMGR